MPFSVRNSTAPGPGRIRDFRHGLVGAVHDKFFNVDDRVKGPTEGTVSFHSAPSMNRCNDKWLASQSISARHYRRADVFDSPSWRRVQNRRVACVCYVCGQDLPVGIGFWRVTLRGPRSVPVCDECRAGEEADSGIR